MAPLERCRLPGKIRVIRVTREIVVQQLDYNFTDNPDKADYLSRLAFKTSGLVEASGVGQRAIRVNRVVREIVVQQLDYNFTDNPDKADYLSRLAFALQLQSSPLTYQQILLC